MGRALESMRENWHAMGNKSCGLQHWGEMQPSEVVMNPKQVFVSVLLFGVAGLLLFMYLQIWIEEQHTGNTSTSSSY